MRKSNKILSIFGVTAMLALFFAFPVSVRAEESVTIADGVYIGNIYVGGMNEEEARQAVDSYVEETGNVMLTLAVGEKSVEVQASELGICFSDTSVIQEAIDVGRSGSLIKRYKDKKDLQNGDKVIELKLDVDTKAVAALMEEQSEVLNQEAVDNSLTRVDGKFQIIKGEQGIEVDVAESIAVIEEYINTDWDGHEAQIELVAEIVEPRGSEEELSQITDLMGGYTTNYNSSNSNRCTNISVAAEKINGTILYPGDEFSVAETIGPLDAANGYQLAGAYENGQTVESYGGGVCQVSSTLYNAVILAELEVTERSNHSMIVTYVEPSMDAAIAGTYKDLKFVNNQELPIYIEGYTVGKNVYFNIYGHDTRPANRKVSYVSEVVSQQDPGTQFVGTAHPIGYIGVAQGKHIGYVARLWKVVTVDGVEESREIVNKSTYKASPKIVNVGTAGDPNAAAIIGAAIATGDEATIYATVAPYTAAAAAPQPAAPQPAAPAVDPNQAAPAVDPNQAAVGQ